MLAAADAAGPSTEAGPAQGCTAAEGTRKTRQRVMRAGTGAGALGQFDQRAGQRRLAGRADKQKKEAEISRRKRRPEKAEEARKLETEDQEGRSERKAAEEAKALALKKKKEELEKNRLKRRPRRRGEGQESGSREEGQGQAREKAKAEAERESQGRGQKKAKKRLTRRQKLTQKKARGRGRKAKIEAERSEGLAEEAKSQKRWKPRLEQSRPPRPMRAVSSIGSRQGRGSEADAARIKATVERYMILDPTMRGKTCTIGVKLASSGFVISVDNGQGDRGSPLGKAAVEAYQLPCPGSAAFEMLSDAGLKSEPEHLSVIERVSHPVVGSIAYKGISPLDFFGTEYLSHDKKVFFVFGWLPLLGE